MCFGGESDEVFFFGVLVHLERHSYSVLLFYNGLCGLPHVTNLFSRLS